MSDNAVQAGATAEAPIELNADTDVSELDLDLSDYMPDSEPASSGEQTQQAAPDEGSPSIEDTMAALGVAQPEPETAEAAIETAPEEKSEDKPAEDRVYNLRREFERKFDNLVAESKEKDAIIERLVATFTDKVGSKPPEPEAPDPLIQRLSELTETDTDPDQAIEAANIRAQLATQRAERVEQRLEQLVGRMEQEQQQAAQATSQQQHLQWASSVAGDAIDSALAQTHLADNIEVKQRIFQSVATKWAEVGYDQRFAQQDLQQLVAAEAAFFKGAFAPRANAPATKRTVLPPPATPPPVVRSRGNPAGQGNGKARKTVADMSEEEFIEFTAQHLQFD